MTEQKEKTNKPIVILDIIMIVVLIFIITAFILYLIEEANPNVCKHCGTILNISGLGNISVVT